MISQAFNTVKYAIPRSPLFPHQLNSKSPELQRKLSKIKHRQKNKQIKLGHSGHGDYFSQIKYVLIVLMRKGKHKNI